MHTRTALLSLIALVLLTLTSACVKPNSPSSPPDMAPFSVQTDLHNLTTHRSSIDSP